MRPARFNLRPGCPPRAIASTRRAFALLYLVAFITLLFGIVTLAVDFGRVQYVKSQAQAAADAAALYAAGGIVGGTPSAVRARAAFAALDNDVDGTPVALDTAADVVLGIWDPSDHTFTVLTGSAESGATAVQVTVRRTQARGNQPKLYFGGAVGLAGKDVGATAVASIGSVSSSTIPAFASPWLAGMGSGASVAATDGNPTSATAPTNSPIQFDTKPAVPIRFSYTTGTTSWNGANSTRQSAAADGADTWIVAQAATNGLNTTSAPLNAMMGVFLDDTAPDTTAPAATMDFTTPASRDFSTLSPQLKQVFYIGDGLDASGHLQSFVPPAGTKRLFIGTMDEHGWWWDNTGTIQFIAVQGNMPILVR